jgi:hypothetical protein
VPSSDWQNRCNIEGIHKKLREFRNDKHIRIVATINDRDQNSEKDRSELLRPYEDRLADHNLDAIAQQLDPVKEWIATDYLNAAKAARNRRAKYYLTEDDLRPVLLSENLQWNLSLCPTFCHSSLLSQMKDEYPFRKLLIERLHILEARPIASKRGDGDKKTVALARFRTIQISISEQ